MSNKQDKAEELMMLFSCNHQIPQHLVKQIVLAHLDKILNLMDRVAAIQGNNFRGTETGGYVDAGVEEKYWIGVREEVIKLEI